ncbi:preprotein translocase subunit SecY [bacterium]|nr:preprotein translocase subunit SecY [bacterium]NBX49374.1 preprotein translocase subunit SecY [bacterium]
MASALVRLWKEPEIRKGLLFILFAVTVFRVVAHIPVPGIDASSLAALLNQSQLLGLLNVFAGGTLSNFSVVALGVAPYITASIIFQLLGMIFPSVEEMQKEEQGRRTLNRWTRVATVPLAALQAYSLMALLGQQGIFGGVAFTTWQWVVAIATMTAGTVFLMWLGELISERKMGNGISILIFAGIVASFPAFIANAAATYTPSELIDMLLFAACTLLTVVGVVFVNEAQRNIPVQYARGGSGKVSSNLPLRVNLGGMIPILFAMSLVVTPGLLAQFFVNANTAWVSAAAQWIIAFTSNTLAYSLVQFFLVILFTFFYASIVFRPEQVSENLQKQGGFIPGVRPGEATTKYLQWVMNRILLIGAVFLAVLAVLPYIVQGITGNPLLAVGGASVLIVVSVVIDVVKQVEAQLSMRSYDA